MRLTLKAKNAPLICRRGMLILSVIITIIRGIAAEAAVSSCLLPGYIEETDDWDFSLVTCAGFGVGLERSPPTSPQPSTRSTPRVQPPITVVIPPPPVKQPPVIESPILEERMNDAPVIGTMPTPREPLRYTMTFHAGITSLHLPIKPRNIYFTDLFKMLGADNVNSLEAFRPTVQAWTIVRSV